MNIASVLSTPTVMVLASGASDKERDNNRGHLFEVFVARLLEVYGFREPTRERLNVTADGVELDVVTNHALTNQPAIAECKAYSASVPTHMLEAFYGKLSVRRLSAPSTFGVFVALPGLTQPGHEQARSIQAQDDKFLLLTAGDVVDRLREKRVIRDPAPQVDELLSDIAVVITEPGVFTVAKRLDPTTRLPEVVRVWGVEGPIPDEVVDLLAGSDYASGLPVRRSVDPLPISALATHEEPRVVEVVGGSSDFEYQLPTSPPFFVGRRGLLHDLRALVSPVPVNGRVLVLNAQSGWGKSSLALRFKSLIEADGGLALVLDARTATGPDFIWVALRHVALKAEESRLLSLPSDASFAGLASSLQTIATATWHQPRKPILLFFDQFENVFQDERLTREFRDLALATPEIPVPLSVGFAWKTDLLGWTEAHPYRLRDDIRDRAFVAFITPFGPAEISTLLRRLERALGERLRPDLSRRLREYSQGLPWLFKKLASHVMRELREGKSQEALLAEGLNVQRLFEGDLGQLSPRELEGLRVIARTAPAAVSEIVELLDPEVVRTLLNQRLVVAVGERIDVYWDIFRDFLNTGRVPVQETYILRLNPPQVARLLSLVINAGGDVSVSSAAQELGTSEGVVFNAARDLRQMGVLVPSPGHVRVADELLGAEDREEAVRERIAQALRRHRAFSLLSSELERHGGELAIARFAEVLPQAFPAVQAQPRTWAVYARAFVHWFSYARLLSKVGDRIRAGSPSQSSLKLLGTSRVTLRQRRSFPQSPPGPAVKVLRTLLGHGPLGDMKSGTVTRALGDLALLGVLRFDEADAISVEVPLVKPDGTVDGNTLHALLTRVPGGAEALALLEDDPRASSEAVGSALARGRGANWKPSTASTAGKNFRAWVRLARGRLPRQYRRRRSATQLPLTF